MSSTLLFAKKHQHKNVVKKYGKAGRVAAARPSPAPVSTEEEEDESSQGSIRQRAARKDHSDEELPSLPAVMKRAVAPSPKRVIPEVVTNNSPKQRATASVTKKRVIVQDPSSNETSSQESSEGKLLTSKKVPPGTTTPAKATPRPTVVVEVLQGSSSRSTARKRKIEQVASSDEEQVISPPVPSDTTASASKGKGKERQTFHSYERFEGIDRSPSPKKPLRRIGNMLVEDDTTNSSNSRSTTSASTTSKAAVLSKVGPASGNAHVALPAATRAKPSLEDRPALSRAASPIASTSGTHSPTRSVPLVYSNLSPSSSSFPSPPPSPPDYLPEEEEQDASREQSKTETFDSAFDDLLGGGAVVIKAVPQKRRPLIRQMSSRRESGSDAGGSSVFSSPSRTPNKQVQGGSDGYFSNVSSPIRETFGHLSPIRSTATTPSGLHALSSAIFSEQSASASAVPTITEVESQPSIPSPPVPTTSKRTYGQTRTILADADILAPFTTNNDHDVGTGPSRPAFFPPKQSYSQLSEQNRSDNDDDPGQGEEEEMEEGGSQSQLHGINALRSAGENRRFTDEMNYMLDGFHDTQPLGVHRASAVEIIRKLRDEDWLRKLKTYDYVGQVYDQFRLVKAGEGDRILDTCLIIFVGRLSQDRRSAELLLQRPSPSWNMRTSSGVPDCLSIILKVIEQPWAKLELGGNERKLGKAEKGMLSTLADIITTPGAEEQPKLSVRSMILPIFAVLCSHKLASSLTALQLVYTSGFLPKLVDILSNIAPDEDSSHISSRDALQVDACLQILDGVASDADQAGAIAALGPQAAHLGPHLVGLVQVCQRMLTDGDDSQSAPSMDLLLSTIKLLVTLANLSPTWSSAITSHTPSILPTLVRCVHHSKSAEVPTTTPHQDGNTSTQSSSSASNAGQTAKFDLLCLSFGLLECLLEASSDCRSLFRNIKENGELALETIKQLYIEYQTDATAQVEKEFLAKYCSLILLYGVLGSVKSQKEIAVALKASSIGVGPLLETMEAIRTLQQQIDESGVEASSAGIELDSAVAEIRKYV